MDAHVEGRELVPAQGPCILAPVHRSNMDTPITSIVTAPPGPLHGQGLAVAQAVLGVVPLGPGRLPREPGHGRPRGHEALPGGAARRASPSCCSPRASARAGPTVQPLFEGAAYLALKAGVPIVPIGIGGSERVMPKGSKLIHPHKVHVIVGEPIVPGGPPGSPGAARAGRRAHERAAHPPAGAVRRGRGQVVA